MSLINCNLQSVLQDHWAQAYISTDVNGAQILFYHAPRSPQQPSFTETSFFVCFSLMCDHTFLLMFTLPLVQFLNTHSRAEQLGKELLSIERLPNS